MEEYEKSTRYTNRTCPICHIKFITAGPDWGYTTADALAGTREYFCTYSCMRVREKQWYDSKKYSRIRAQYLRGARE